MRTLIAAFLILFSFTAYSLGFGSKSSLVQIKTDKKEFTYIDITDMPIVYDAEDNVAYIGYHHKTNADSFGKYQLIFIPLKTFEFDTKAQFVKWIKSVKSEFKCLTIEGIVKC